MHALLQNIMDEDEISVGILNGMSAIQRSSFDKCASDKVLGAVFSAAAQGWDADEDEGEPPVPLTYEFFDLHRYFSSTRDGHVGGAIPVFVLSGYDGFVVGKDYLKDMFDGFKVGLLVIIRRENEGFGGPHQHSLTDLHVSVLEIPRLVGWLKGELKDLALDEMATFERVTNEMALESDARGAHHQHRYDSSALGVIPSEG